MYIILIKYNRNGSNGSNGTVGKTGLYLKANRNPDLHGKYHVFPSIDFYILSTQFHLTWLGSTSETG